MKILTYLFLALTIAVFANAQEETTQTGRKAPNFKLENIEGDYVELNQYLGKGPVLLSFFATWCKPCLEEMVENQKLYDEYKEKGFQLIGISTDDERTVAKVKPYVRSKHYTFPILLDTNSEVSRIYYAQAIPFTVLLDKNGTIVYSHLGYMRGDELQIKKRVKEMLEK